HPQAERAGPLADPHLHGRGPAQRQRQRDHHDPPAQAVRGTPDGGGYAVREERTMLMFSSSESPPSWSALTAGSIRPESHSPKRTSGGRWSEPSKASRNTSSTRSCTFSPLSIRASTSG